MRASSSQRGSVEKAEGMRILGDFFRCCDCFYALHFYASERKKKSALSIQHMVQ